MASDAGDIGSEAWCAAMSDLLKGVELPEVQVIVEQRIGDGNGGPPIAYRLVLASGRAHVAPAPASGNSGASDTSDSSDSSESSTADSDDSMVVMSQSRATVESVRRGELSALAALQAGLIRVSGDVRVLIAAAEALAAVDAALGAALVGEPSSSEPGSGGGQTGRDDVGGAEM